MYHILDPVKDATIYEYDPERNTGADEILELDQENGEEARFLSQFDLDRVKSKILDRSDFSSEVVFRTSRVSNLPFEYDIKVYPLLKKWERGRGRRFDVPKTTKGVNWNKTGFEDWDNKGGDFDEYFINSRTYRFERSDIRIEITDIVDGWVNGNLDNYGIIVTCDPFSEQRDFELKFFGGLSHSIFTPFLAVKYDDSVFDSTIDSSLGVTATGIEIDDHPVLSFNNLQDEYTRDINRFHISTRKQYDQQNFVENWEKPNPTYIKNGDLQYRVKEFRSGKVMVPFGSHSKVSFMDGYYFDIDFTNFYPERYYEIDLKFMTDTGLNIDLTPDTNRFKII